MNQLKSSLIALFLLCLSYSHIQAQAFIPYSYKDIGYVSVGAYVGLANYFGDLNPAAQYVSTDLSKTRLSLGVEVSRKLSPRLIARAGLAWARIAASDFEASNPSNERDVFRYIRNSHFRNDIFELSLVFTWDLFPSRFVYHKRLPFTPYLVAGISAFYHDPRARVPTDEGYINNYLANIGATELGANPGDWVRLRPLRTEGQGLTRNFPNLTSNPSDPQPGSSYDRPYSLFQAAIPLGLGLRFKITDRIDASFEIAYRILFTDYIDDVGGNYADARDLVSQVGPLSAILANRSFEPTDPRTGESRISERDDFISTRNAGIAVDELGNPTVDGFGRDGDKRGEKNNPDVLIIAAFHLQYIIGVGLKCPAPGDKRKKYRRY